LPNLVLFLGSYADFLLYLDRLPESKSLAEEYLDLTQTIALRLRIPGALNCLGIIESRMGHHHHAYNLIKEGYERMHEMGIIWVEAIYLSDLGKVTTALGDYHQAEQYLKQSLQIGFRIKSVQNMIITLVHLAELRLAQGLAKPVAAWLGLSLHHSVNARVRQKEIRELLDNLKTQLPADEIEAALERGKTLDLTKVVEEILATM
jgi:tetratricopeptide (TPR) repeat protein